MATDSMQDVEKYPSQVIYDPAAATPIAGVDANTSLVARAPKLIAIDAIPAGTTAELEVRLTAGALWKSVSSLDSTTTPDVFHMDNANFVRVVRTGVGDFTVEAQP